jgi:hypothetical protein
MESTEELYHLSINNLTDKQPSIVNTSNYVKNIKINKFQNFSFIFKYNTLDISKDLIVYGTEKNTGALFIYRRNPYSFFKAVPGNVIRGKVKSGFYFELFSFSMFPF